MKALLVIGALSLLLGGCGTVQGFGRGVRDVGVAAVTPAPVYVAPPVYRRPYWRGRGYYRRARW